MSYLYSGKVEREVTFGVGQIEVEVIVGTYGLHLTVSNNPRCHRPQDDDVANIFRSDLLDDVSMIRNQFLLPKLAM